MYEADREELLKGKQGAASKGNKVDGVRDKGERTK